MLRRLALVLESIKFQHSVFALPFALIAMLVAADGWPSLRTLVWIVAACVFARSAAMGFNRWADADLDARNPRTAGRALPAGQLSRSFMIGFVGINAVLFVLAAAMLNTLCLVLSLPTLAVLLGYSYSKRFTAESHFWLGAALGLAPIGAWIAVTGSLHWIPLVLGASVMLWVGGFDILYSCQDVEVDRREGLQSLPARLGIARALDFSAAAHALAWGGFFTVGMWSPLGGFFAVGLAAAAVLLIWQHRIVKPDDLSRVNAAFFNANGLLSLGLFVAAVLDTL